MFFFYNHSVLLDGKNNKLEAGLIMRELIGFLLLLLQTEKPERRHTFASLALRKRYSYLTEPGTSEFDVFTNI